MVDKQTRAGGSLGRPEDDWRSDRDGARTNMVADRLEHDLKLIPGSRQLGAVGDVEVAPVVVELS